jgi:hypothetical protein
VVEEGGVSAAEITPAPGQGPREERYRLASVAAGVPLLLLVAPLVMPLQGGRSLLGAATREPIALLIVGGLVLWSLLTGGLSLAYGLRRRVPGTLAFAVPAVVYALPTGGLAFLALFALGKVHGEAETGIAALTALSCSLAVYLLLRGFRRGGWERWAQLVAGVWLAHGTIALLMVFGDASLAGDQDAGAWVLLFALSALAPIVGWALWPRRGEATLLRSTTLRS